MSSNPNLFERIEVKWLTAAIAALVFLPWLGAVGLWDPWETHYSEVGRQMWARGDFIHPYWEKGWFFSKPPLTPWLAAFGLWVAGATSTSGEMPRYTEWCIRLPFALLAISAVSLLSHAVSRLASRAAGIACGLALSTMPLFFFTARQAMTDMPFVACVTIAWACALLGQLDAAASEQTRSRWWLGFYAAMGVAALGKGLLSGLPAVCWALWWGTSQPWATLRKNFGAQLRHMQLVKGALLFAAIAVPWYAAMIAFDGRDNGGLVFWRRFFLHDHFNRLLAGVHTTTPDTTFTYFVEQGGYGIFPWVGLLPGAIFEAVRVHPREENTRARLTTWASLVAIFGFGLFTASATKFHHYILPVLPAIAVLVGLFIARLLEEGPGRHTLVLLLGVVIFALVGKDLAARPRHFVDLFTYNYQRPYPDFLVTQPFGPEAPKWLTLNFTLGVVMALAVFAAAWATARYASRGLLAVSGTLALSLALWLSWSHWVSLSHHWTQRDLFGRYWQQREPNEPIAVYFMDWKGETFYSRNQVLQLKPDNWSVELPRFIDQPGRKWMLTEHSRLNALRSVIPQTHPMRLVESALNNKFVLVVVD